ncbi:MAG: Rrf2 family transcriptional regulator [Bdellovibrionota bacterium]
MQLSLSSDYACRVLIFLSVQEKSSIPEIAERFSISQNHLVKVVHRLSGLGYLKTTRGRGGGLTLAKPPHEITVGEVIRKMEPHLDLVECFNEEKNACVITGACGLKHLLKSATVAFLSKLDSCTFEQISARKRALRSSLFNSSGSRKEGAGSSAPS